MNFQTILKFAGFVLLVFIGLIVLLKVLGFLSIIVSMIFGLLFLAGFIWLIWSLFQLGTGPAASNTNSNSSKSGGHKLFSVGNSPVAMFLQSPSMNELISAEIAQKREAFEDEGKALQIDCDCPIQVIDDSKPEAVKIKVLDGMSKGKSGWVARSSIVKEPPRLG